jgi:hypothetical protein
LTLQKFTGFDCLTTTNDDDGGGGVFSSDFICRGGTGVGGEMSINIKIFQKKKQSDVYLLMVYHPVLLE